MMGWGLRPRQTRHWSREEQEGLSIPPAPNFQNVCDICQDSSEWSSAALSAHRDRQPCGSSASWSSRSGIYLFGSGQTDFGPQLKSLNKEHFTIVAWDPRGYGNSIPPNRDFPPDFFERDAKDAVDLMKVLNFKKFSLLGWSDGGITALIAAGKYPSLIHKMVVWGANSYVTEEDLKAYDAIRDISKWSEKMRKPLEDMYGTEYLAKTFDTWVTGISQYKNNPDGNICRHWLPAIVCPTLIIHGQKDALIPSFHPEFLHRHIKDSRLHLIPEGKHNLHLRFSEEFNKLVEDFLL
uniref:Valacyclovir hydrolase isoform X2 n=1 Tax=Geotrypetes seraphini TaxID=260995 RepID=A0A6P8Q3E7_GEOSA|nr:valacyclovir hydrolase isoform X2 [Geotrypetes seraphini]